jgi:hypothetical protein
MSQVSAHRVVTADVWNAERIGPLAAEKEHPPT